MRRWKRRNPTQMFAVVTGTTVRNEQYTKQSFRMEQKEWMRGVSESKVVDRFAALVVRQLGGRAAVWMPPQRTVLRWWRRVDVGRRRLLVHFVGCHLGGCAEAHVFRIQ